MTEREPLTRRVIEAAREHAWGAHHDRVIIWDGEGYFDTDDTEIVRRRFRGQIVAEVSWDGHVEKLKQKKARRAK